jgi:mannosyltransferase
MGGTAAPARQAARRPGLSDPLPATTRDDARTRNVALLAAPALLATGLCLVEISRRSLGFDESATVAIAAQHGSALWSAIAHDGGNMSGYYVLMHVLFSLFGKGLLVLRLPSAIAAGIAAALLGALALRLFDRRVALVAALLSAVSLPLVFWGQSARSYAWLVALVTGSFLAFVSILEGRRPRAAWTGYVLCTALAMYASLMAILIVPAQLVILAWHRGRARAVIWALVAVATCCVPLMVLVAGRGSGQLFWVPRPDWNQTTQVLQALTSAGLVPNFHASSTTTTLLVCTIVALAVIAAAVVRTRSWEPALALCWLLVPALIAYVESLVGQSIFLPRNLLICLPAVALLLAWGITRPAVPPLIGAAVLAALLALRALQLAPSYGVSPEDWRAATGYVVAHTTAADCVAFYPSDGRNAFRYYLHAGAQAPRPVLPTVPFSSSRAYIEDYATLSSRGLHLLRRSCPRLWLVSSHEGQVNGTAGSRANYSRYVALRDTLAAEYARTQVRSFGYAAPVTVELFAPSKPPLRAEGWSPRRSTR